MVGTVAFVVPVTISFMDKIGMIVKVEGASMQVYMCIIPCLCLLLGVSLESLCCVL